jgi:hypothetical protein
MLKPWTARDAKRGAPQATKMAAAAPALRAVTLLLLLACGSCQFGFDVGQVQRIVAQQTARCAGYA